MNMSGHKNSRDPNTQHHHKGKSSESLLDKKQILSSLNIVRGQVILDAGCGNGYMAKEFAKMTGPEGVVYALDPDEQAIESLTVETLGTHIDPFVGDITRPTKLAEASVDLIYVSMVMHGFSRKQVEGCKSEIHRILKPGARLAVVEMKKEEMPFGPPIEIRFSPEELQQSLGLTPVHLVDLAPYSYLQIFQK